MSYSQLTDMACANTPVERERQDSTLSAFLTRPGSFAVNFCSFPGPFCAQVPFCAMGEQMFRLDTMPADIISTVSMLLPPASTRSLRLAHPRLSSASFNPQFINADHVVRAVEHCCTTALPDLIHTAPTPRAISWAAYRNNVAALRLLLTPSVAGPPAEDTLADAVSICAEKNHTEALALLLEYIPMPAPTEPSADVADETSRPKSPIATAAFLKAAAAGHIPALRLLQEYAEVTVYDSAPLRLAAASSRLPAVAFLLSTTASDPGGRDHQPLRHAARDNNAALVQLLVPHAPQRARNAALAAAATRGAVDAARALLLAGADPRADRDLAVREANDFGCPVMIDLLSRAGNGEGSGRGSGIACGSPKPVVGASRKPSQFHNWASKVFK